MKRTLRVGFAMGGGVSLGTFNGVALTEAIKLLVLGGQDQTERRYDRVQIDVFSGASAGALALGLMLRGLADPESAEEVLKRLQNSRKPGSYGGPAANLDVWLDQAVEAGKRPAPDSETYKLLLHAQLIQDVQREAWGRDQISLKRMLAEGRQSSTPLQYVASLFNRAAVDEIAACLFDWPLIDGDAVSGGRVNVKPSPLLAERVLYCCTLSNLTARRMDSRGQEGLEPASAYEMALADGMTSLGNREIRTFDLRFRAIPEAETAMFDGDDTDPERWCRYHLGERVSGRIGSLRHRRSWCEIAATAVASGAFPFAFEPAILRRRWYELGRTADGGDQAYAYVDGGVFNNEPIREAYRLAAFIDATEPPEAGEETDRVIVFVDPNIPPPQAHPSTAVPVLREYELLDTLGTDFDRWELTRLPTLSRLLPHIGTVAGTLANEASVVEADRVAETRNQFIIRKAIREHLGRNLTVAPELANLIALSNDCVAQLQDYRRRHNLPGGSADLGRELRRVRHEEPAILDALTDDEIDTFVRNGTMPSSNAGLLLKALAFVGIDLGMDLTSKRQGSWMIPIAPIQYGEVGDGEQRQVYALPGGRLCAFAGFMSTHSLRYEFAMAEYCTRAALSESGFPPLLPKGLLKARQVPEFPPAEEAAFEADIEAGIKAIAGRLDSSLFNWLDTFKYAPLTPIAGPLLSPLRPALSWLVKRGIAKGLKSAAFGEPATVYELRIRVPGSSGYEMHDFAGTERDDAPIQIGEEWWLITFVARRAGGSGKSGWEGRHLDWPPHARRPVLRVDGPGLAQYKIAVPSEALFRQADTSIRPVFTADIGQAHAASVEWTLARPFELGDRILSLMNQ